jgi:hypothetical protein
VKEKIIAELNNQINDIFISPEGPVNTEGRNEKQRVVIGLDYFPVDLGLAPALENVLHLEKRVAVIREFIILGPYKIRPYSIDINAAAYINFGGVLPTLKCFLVKHKSLL